MNEIYGCLFLENPDSPIYFDIEQRYQPVLLLLLSAKPTLFTCCQVSSM
jgi:hypothetical protein